MKRRKIVTNLLWKKWNVDEASLNLGRIGRDQRMKCSEHRRAAQDYNC